MFFFFGEKISEFLCNGLIYEKIFTKYTLRVHIYIYIRVDLIYNDKRKKLNKFVEHPFNLSDYLATL